MEERIKDEKKQLRVRIEGSGLIESVEAVIPKGEPDGKGKLALVDVFYQKTEEGLLPSVSGEYYRPEMAQYARYVWLGEGVGMDKLKVEDAEDVNTLQEMKRNTEEAEDMSLLYHNPDSVPPKFGGEKGESLRTGPQFDLVSIVSEVAPQDIEVPSDLETDVPVDYPSGSSPAVEEFTVDPKETNVRVGPGFEPNLLLLGHRLAPGIHLYGIEHFVEGPDNAVAVIFEGGKICIIANSERGAKTAKQNFLEDISLARDPDDLMCLDCEKKMKPVPFSQMSQRYLDGLTDEQLSNVKNGLRGYSRCPSCGIEIEWVTPDVSQMLPEKKKVKK